VNNETPVKNNPNPDNPTTPTKTSPIDPAANVAPSNDGDATPLTAWDPAVSADATPSNDGGATPLAACTPSGGTQWADGAARVKADQNAHASPLPAGSPSGAHPIGSSAPIPLPSQLPVTALTQEQIRNHGCCCAFY